MYENAVKLVLGDLTWTILIFYYQHRRGCFSTNRGYCHYQQKMS
ncbi:hypothetical protein NC652_024408 [Populus alba x Populus x berolinensis]|nr:hypothetical protein NC652_024408 [Populus alba x Populus x berolinensis]